VFIHSSFTFSTYYFWFIKSCAGIHADTTYRLCPATLSICVFVPVWFMMRSAVILSCGLLRFDTLLSFGRKGKGKVDLYMPWCIWVGRVINPYVPALFTGWRCSVIGVYQCSGGVYSFPLSVLNSKVAGYTEVILKKPVTEPTIVKGKWNPSRLTVIVVQTKTWRN